MSNGRQSRNSPICYPHMPTGSVDYIGYCLSVCVCVCLLVRLGISPATIKLAASNFARWFTGVLGRKSPILGNSNPSEAQNRTNRRAAAIADRRQSPPLTARSPSKEGTGVCRQYLPSACVDIRPSPKTDVLVSEFVRSKDKKQSKASLDVERTT